MEKNNKGLLRQIMDDQPSNPAKAGQLRMSKAQVNQFLDVLIKDNKIKFKKK